MDSKIGEEFTVHFPVQCTIHKELLNDVNRETRKKLKKKLIQSDYKFESEQ
jgi:hypothetical protein